MKSLLAITYATIYGLSLRMFVGVMGDLMGVMSIGFLMVAPGVIGFLTIWFTPKTRNGVIAFFKPWLTSLVILIITVLINVEGTICWMMIYPLFSIVAGIGGVIAYHVRKNRTGKEEDKDSETPLDWQNKDTLQICFVLLIPIVVGVLEGDRSLSQKDFTISEEVVIDASPEQVWKQLTAINDLMPNERHSSFSHLMGFPSHLNTTLDTLAVGGKRKAIYENGLYFDEVISSYEHARKLVLDINVDPAKIPPTVMDEHIIIGGKHVDIEEDTYTLEPLADGKTRLILTSRFWINTPFNWYAGIWSEYLMEDILNGELELLKDRTEK